MSQTVSNVAEQKVGHLYLAESKIDWIICLKTWLRYLERNEKSVNGLQVDNNTRLWVRLFIYDVIWRKDNRRKGH